MPSEKEYEVVFIREVERVVIPCRGSVENLNVTLHTVRKSSKNRKKSINSVFESLKYNFQNGFTRLKLS